LHFEWPRLLLAALHGRLAAAIPLAVAGIGVLLLATAWNLRASQVEPAARYDARASGELLRYRWVVREPDAEERALNWTQGQASLELGVRWRAPDGAPREAWWRSGEDVMLSYLADTRLDPLGRLIGLPWVELSLPPAVRPLLGPVDAPPSLAALAGPAPPGMESARALIAPLDDVLSLLAAQAGAIAPDWTIAYRRDDPSQATLAALDRIDAAAVATMPVALLVAVALAGGLLLAGGAGTAFERAWLGWLLALVLMPGVPLWAPHAQAAAAWTGIESGTAELLRDLALRASSESAGEAAFQLVPATAPTAATDAPIVRWLATDLPAAPMLGVLGIDRDLPAAGSFEQRYAALIERGAANIAALDDDALVALIQRWHPEEFGRYAALRVPWIDGLCRASVQSQRSSATQRWIEFALGAPAICDVR
jgi:hypothetical protein